MERPRLPLTWADWVSGDWLGDANPIGVVKPALAGSLDGLGRAVGATLGAIDKTTAVAPQFMLEAILEGARNRLRGRDLVVRHGDGELRLRLADLHFELAALPLAVGQLGTIHVDTSDVAWPGGRLTTMHVDFANVHIRPGLSPRLITAPVRVRATLGQDALDDFLADVADKVRVELGDHVATAFRPGREAWGHASVEPRLEGGRVRLVATGLTVRSRALRAPGGGLPSFLIDLPTLPRGLRVTHMELGDHRVVVDALVEELEEPITAQQLAKVASLVRAGADDIDFGPERT